ncbi:hypothetical protein [Paenibacillus phoenicis]|uniref:hypothetical protein n=1 Tax=Paenibacillus phoenicis TaxID=554117 RepID=UPI003D2DE3F7
MAKAIGSISLGTGEQIYGGISTVYEDLGETAVRCAEALRLLTFHVLDGRQVLTPSYGEAVMSERSLPAFGGSSRAGFGSGYRPGGSARPEAEISAGPV